MSKTIPSNGLLELANLLNLIHEIAAVHKLHDKVETVLKLRHFQIYLKAKDGPLFGSTNEVELETVAFR